jgi:hypothetical protein
VHGQPHNVEIATLDVVNKAGGESLNPIAAGLVKWLAGVNVFFNFNARQTAEVDDSVLYVQPGLALPSETDPRIDVVGPA